MSFVHLHTHSEFSFLDGLPTLEGIVSRVAELGQTAVAVTDHGECVGHLKLQKAAKARGIKPLFGIETYFTDDVSVRPKDIKGDSEAFSKYEHMLLIAKDEVGLRNLWTLSSLAYTEGFYHKPRIDFSMLERYHEGLIGTGGCVQGSVSAYFCESKKQYDPDKGLQRLGRFMELFEDDFYLELHTFLTDDTRGVSRELVQLSQQYGTKLIACSDSHFLRQDDWEEHETLIAWQMKRKIDDPDRYQYGPDSLYLHSEEQARAKLTSFLDADVVNEAIENTARIAEQCNVEIEHGTTSLPVFFDEAQTDKRKLMETAYRKLEERATPLGLSDVDRKRYRERLEIELDLILDKGFAGYFLIVADAVSWCKANGILIGPGRGSVGGSLLAYVLGITEIDPVRLGLPFGRFLTRGRVSLPDIDVDVDQVRRSKLHEYLRDKYYMAVVGSLITAAPRALIRDFTRVMKIPRSDAEQMSEIVASVKDLGVSQLEVTWDDVMEQKGEQLRPWIQKYGAMFALMGKFKDHATHSGAHAGGVVIDKEPLLGRIPLRFKNDEVRTQMDMKDTEALGFNKVDFLGLRTLTTLTEAHTLIGERLPHFYEWQYNWDHFYEDSDVLEDIASGWNTGLFQLETWGISDLARRYKPTTFLDIAAIISLFRPGITRAIDPKTGKNLMDMYLAKRDGSVDVEYRHPLLKEVLGHTYGVFLYQEEVMAACGAIAGYSEEEQDKVRAILGKGTQAQMKAQRGQFVLHAQDHSGIDEALANSIFDEMEMFGTYSFGMAHAVGYAMTGYWGAYLKHHFPREFLTALFRTDEDNSARYTRECYRLGIPVLGPDVNESEATFTLTKDNEIRYGLHRVKQLKKGAALIEKLRPFVSVSDFLMRVPRSAVNKLALENLVRVGAFDEVVSEEERNFLPADWSPAKCALYIYTAVGKTAYKESDFQLLLMDVPVAIQRPTADDLASFEKYAKTLDIDNRAAANELLLGANILSEETIAALRVFDELIAKNDRYPGVERMYFRENAPLGGYIRRIRTFTTKKGDEMSHIWVERVGKDAGTERVVVFPQQYRQYKRRIASDVPVLVQVQRLENEEVCAREIVRLDEL